MSRMNRVQNWESLFFARIMAVSNTPFSWGIHDCVTCAASLVQVITGQDLIADFRGRYRTEKGALNALKKAGFESLEQAVTSKLTPAENINELVRGDVVLCGDDTGKRMLGVKAGTVAVSPGTHGLNHIPPDQWVKGWKV